MPRITVCLPARWPPWRLPGSVIGSAKWIPGGYRTLHETAFAALVAGHDVELRGRLHEPTLRSLSEATGATPRIGMEPRAPERGEIIVMPEGLADPMPFATVSLSAARPVVFVLAAPGLFGWDFTGPWEPPDPLTVPIEDVARPEQFHSMIAMGFRLWVNSRGLEKVILDAGAECRFVRTGRPLPAFVAQERTHDLAVIKSNRWAPLAYDIAARINASVLEIEDVDNKGMFEALSRARILVWPSRVEGDSRIQAEARLAGTVPVGLASNPYTDGFVEENGAVPADSLDEMPLVIEKLLADPDRLARASEAGMRTARANIDWDAHVASIDAAINDAAAIPISEPRAVFGEGARARLDERVADVEKLLAMVKGNEERVAIERTRTDRMEERLRGAEASLSSLRARKAVRFALAASRMVRRFTGRGGP